MHQKAINLKKTGFMPVFLLHPVITSLFNLDHAQASLVCYCPLSSTVLANIAGFSLYAGVAAEAYQRDQLRDQLRDYIGILPYIHVVNSIYDTDTSEVTDVNL